MSKKIIVHGCAGAGISISDKVYSFVESIDTSGKAEVLFNAIDTSDANFKDTKHLKDVIGLHKISNANLTNNILDGSGGIRAHSSTSIIKGTKEYLDKYKYLSPEKGTIHLIISSASGGSGNMIAVELLSNLMAKEIPVVLVLIGDSSTAKYAENTRKTLLTVNNISKANERIVSIRYLLNNYSSYKTVQEAQMHNDGEITMLLDLLSTFNGDVKDLDFQDLFNITNPKAKDFGIPTGVYSLISKVGDSENEKLSNNLTPIISRTIIQNFNEYVPLNIVQTKTGTIENAALKENVQLLHSDNNLTLLLAAGGLQAEIDYLKNIEDEIFKSISKVKDSLDISSNETPDENGLVL